MPKKYICNKAKDKSCEFIDQCTMDYNTPQHGMPHEKRHTCVRGLCDLSNTVVKCVEVDE